MKSLTGKEGRFLIEGYYCNADMGSQHDEQSLLDLCENRAKAVKKKLIEAGIPGEHIYVIAVGKHPSDYCAAEIRLAPDP